jgi:hypothetical protein
MKQVETIKDAICLTRVAYGKLITFYNIQLDRDLFIFNCKKHGQSIGPTNLFLCVLDIYQSRFSILLISLLSDFNKKYNNYKMTPVILKIMKFKESIRFQLKNNTYKLLALWESLVIGYTINDSVNDLGFSELYDSTLNEILEIKNHLNFLIIK